MPTRIVGEEQRGDLRDGAALRRADVTLLFFHDVQAKWRHCRRHRQRLCYERAFSFKPRHVIVT